MNTLLGLKRNMYFKLIPLCITSYFKHTTTNEIHVNHYWHLVVSIVNTSNHHIFLSLEANIVTVYKQITDVRHPKTKNRCVRNDQIYRNINTTHKKYKEYKFKSKKLIDQQNTEYLTHQIEIHCYFLPFMNLHIA